jgi:hypothetical protein
VNWLRAKARHRRWQEEVTILENEMVWIKLWFEHEMKVWEDRQKQSTSSGHRIFAAKQVWVWNRFLSDATQSFADAMAQITK